MPRSLRGEHSEATRQALIASGREAFGAAGYHDAAIEAVARAARVSRGALYHHFRDKRALFEAVVVQMQAEAADEIDARAAAKRDAWAQLVEGVDAYFEICRRPHFRRIVVEDAPAALGKAPEPDKAHPVGWLTAKLRALQDAGRLADVNVATLASLIGAMVSEGAAILSAKGASPEQVHATLRTILDGVKKPGKRG